MSCPTSRDPASAATAFYQTSSSSARAPMPIRVQRRITAMRYQIHRRPATGGAFFTRRAWNRVTRGGMMGWDVSPTFLPPLEGARGESRARATRSRRLRRRARRPASTTSGTDQASQPTDSGAHQNRVLDVSKRPWERHGRASCSDAAVDARHVLRHAPGVSGLPMPTGDRRVTRSSCNSAATASAASSDP